MNKKILLISLTSATMLIGCNGGSGGGSTTAAPSANQADKQSTYGEFLQRIDPKTGVVLKSAKQILASSALNQDNDPVSLGSAYYGDNGYVAIGNTCIDNRANLLVDYGNTTANLNYSKNMTSSQLQNKLGISGSINGEIGKFKGNIEGSYLNETSSDDTSISYNFLAILNSTATLKNVGSGNERAKGMDDHIEQLKAKTEAEATNFYNACGDHYISQVPAGAYISTTVKLVFKSASDKTQFDAAMSASIESIGAISAAVNAFNASTGKSEDVNVYALQVGGLPEKLFSIFDSKGGANEGSDDYHSYNLLTCGISNIDACTNLIADVIHYTSNDFKQQITGSTGKYTNLAQFGDPIQQTNYDNILGYSNATAALALVQHGNGGAADSAQEIVRMQSQDQSMLTYADDYLASPGLSSDLSNQLAAIQKIYTSRVKYYTTNATKIINSCFKGQSTLDDNTSCQALSSTISKNRSVGGVYQLTTAQLNLLKYLDANGFIAGGTTVNKSTPAVLYPAGSSVKSSDFSISPMLGLNLLLDGFNSEINVNSANNQLAFSGELSNGSKKIEITTPIACPKAGTTYTCSGVEFHFSGFSEEEQAKYTNSLNTTFNTKWSTGKNYYLNTNKNYL